MRILLLNNTEITGGPNGISQIPKPTFFGLEFSRTAREGGWDTFSNFFGLKYDPSDRVIFLYLVALLLVVLSLFVINRLLRMPLGRAWDDAVVAKIPELAGIKDAAPDATFRIRGQKLAREPHRYSGRTAMRANISVHEPRQPQDIHWANGSNIARRTAQHLLRVMTYCSYAFR